jgi:transposase-like protein
VRDNGHVVSQAIVIAIAVTANGEREVLGLDVGPSENGAFWLAFLRDLAARGLGGVKLVTSDAHAGLKAAIGFGIAGCDVAAVPCALHARCPRPGAEERPADGRGDD